MSVHSDTSHWLSVSCLGEPLTLVRQQETWTSTTGWAASSSPAWRRYSTGEELSRRPGVTSLCRWGQFLTRHPYPVILTAITTTALCSLGFLVFRWVMAAWRAHYYRYQSPTYPLNPSVFYLVLYNEPKIMFRIEHQANLLWIPADSDYNTREDWLDMNFKSKSRDEIILFSSENILTPESIKEVNISLV